MPYSDYKCGNCFKVFEFYKASVIQDFPKQTECPECGCSANRKYSGSVLTEVAEGLCGNSKTGYGTGITYHPTSIVGKVKGTRIKK
jgi:hypothetical protein